MTPAWTRHAVGIGRRDWPFLSDVAVIKALKRVVLGVGCFFKY